MPIFTKIDLSHAVGKVKSTISMNITRGNLVEHNGMIDDSHPTNRKTIDKWLKPLGGNYIPPSEAQELKAKSLKERRAKAKEPKAEKPKKPKKDIFKKSVDIDDRKKIAETEYKLEQIEHLKLRSAKLKGENVPVKMVEGLFIMLGTAFQTEYKDLSENLLSELAHECKIGNKMHAKYKGLFMKMINSAHHGAVEAVELELKAITSENSSKIAMEND